MKYKSHIIIILLLIPLFGLCLTEKSKVSILTTEPGTEFYTIFGHTAIRINDESLNIDRVYNFGTFDFNTSFFYFKFLKGDLDYYLSIDNYDTLLHYSIIEHRNVYEQILDLDYNEKLDLFNNLEMQYNSDERSYKYDFFYDNCATRVRDAILDVQTNPIKYDSLKYCCLTFRQILAPYISKNYWINCGINISLGKEADKIARPNDFMFLPNYIMEIFHDSQIVQEKILLHDSSNSSNKTRNFTYVSPWIIVSVLIVLSIIARLFSFPRLKEYIFYVYTFFIGFVGLLLLLIGLYSDNPAFSGNLNIYWTLPSLIIILTHKRPVNNIFKILYITFLVIMLLTWTQFSQEFSITFIPWIIALIIIILLDLPWINKKNFC